MINHIPELKVINGVEINKDLNNLISSLKYNNYPILLAGSSGLHYNAFVSDFDLICNISPKPQINEIYSEMQNIFEKLLLLPNVWIIELKLQDKNGKKIKLFPDDIFKESDLQKVYDDLSMIKLDLIMDSQNLFYEVSCIYNFEEIIDDEKEQQKIEKDIEEDITDLEKEKKYYKVLKRKFLIYKMNEDRPKIKKLLKIFNSPLGEKYAFLHRLKALYELHKYYKDPNTTKRILYGLKHLGIKEPIPSLENKIKNLENKINTLAKKIN